MRHLTEKHARQFDVDEVDRGSAIEDGGAVRAQLD